MTNLSEPRHKSLWERRLEKALRLSNHGIDNLISAIGKFSRKYSSQHILLYTDSRGKNLHGYDSYKHYSTRLSQAFYVDAYLAPEKWTTIPDFLALYNKLSYRKYNYIILHAGIVDASPRHQKSIQQVIYPQKKSILDSIFSAEALCAYYQSDLGVEYEGDKTMNLYSLEMAQEKLIPLLVNIPNLIWISHNRIVPGWQGNYWKPRPDNINIIEEYSKLFSKELADKIEIIELMNWSIENVKQFTFDNIHPNQAGSDYIFSNLMKAIQHTHND